MREFFPLVPRYRLDDEQPWLLGIDPLRRYWLSVNGGSTVTALVPGLNTESFETFRTAMRSFRQLQAGETIHLPTALGTSLDITCVSNNCFLIAGNVNGAAVSHVFDQESLESLLMTAHPDWCCAPHHKELGCQVLSLSWSQPAAAKVA